eukprot:217119_1
MLHSALQIYQILQILFVYSAAYSVLQCIDKFIINHAQHLSLRMTLSLLCSLLIYNTYPEGLHRLDYAIVQHCTFIFFAILKLNILVFYNDKITRHNQTFSSFICNWLWIPYPIIKQKDTLHLQISLRNVFRMIITDLLPSMAFGMVGFVMSFYFLLYLELCLDDAQKVSIIADHYWYLTWYSFINMMQLLSILLFLSSLFTSLVRVFSFNRYTHIPFNNYPLLSVSMRETWSKRYNYWIRSILHQNVFKPLLDSGYSAAVAAFMTFVVSGLLHVFISSQFFRTAYSLSSTLWFFVLHAVIIRLETYVYDTRKRNELSTVECIVRVCLTNAIFTMTLPFYIGLWVREYPELGLLIHQENAAMFDNENIIAMMNFLPKMQCVYPIGEPSMQLSQS